MDLDSNNQIYCSFCFFKISFQNFLELIHIFNQFGYTQGQHLQGLARALTVKILKIIE